MPMVPSTRRLVPWTRRFRLSLDTPGMSACKVIPSRVSKMSTSGRRDPAVAAFACEDLPSLDAAGVVTSVPVFMMCLLGSSNGNLPGLGRLAAPDGDLHDAISIGRVDLVGIDIVRATDHAPEIAIEAFLPVVGRFVVACHLACSADREQVLLHGDVELPGVDSRREQVHRHAVFRATYIDGRKSPGR